MRPIKFTLCSSDAVQRVLSRAGRLKTEGEQYRGVYLSVDKTLERSARKKLVQELKQKQKRETEPELNHLIRNNTIFVAIINLLIN